MVAHDRDVVETDRIIREEKRTTAGCLNSALFEFKFRARRAVRPRQ